MPVYRDGYLRLASHYYECRIEKTIGRTKADSHTDGNTEMKPLEIFNAIMAVFALSGVIAFVGAALGYAATGGH